MRDPTLKVTYLGFSSCLQEKKALASPLACRSARAVFARSRIVLARTNGTSNLFLLAHSRLLLKPIRTHIFFKNFFYIVLLFWHLCLTAWPLLFPQSRHSSGATTFFILIDSRSTHIRSLLLSLFIIIVCYYIRHNTRAATYTYR